MSEIVAASQLSDSAPADAPPRIGPAKFATVAASGYGINLLLFGVLVHGLGSPYLLAGVAAFLVAVANNYVWNRQWTFRPSGGAVSAQGVRYLAVSLAGLGLNLALLGAFVWAGVERVGAQAAAIALVMPLNYFGNRRWAFHGAAAGVEAVAPTYPARALVAGARPRLAALAADFVASGRRAAYLRIVAWWAGSRAVVLGAVLVAQALGWPRKSWYPGLLENPFALLHAWDGRWYMMVAQRGYFVVPRHQSDPAFFPLYPMLMNGLHALGLPLLPAGLLLANAGFLVALLALYELVRTWLPEEDARRTAVYAALFPFGFVFSMIYPEAIVLAAIALGGVFAVRGRWTAAGLAAAVAALGRPEGLFLVLPLAALALQRWPHSSLGDRARSLWAVLAGPSALAALAAHQWLNVGDPLAFSHAQRAWGRWFSIGGVERAVSELLRAPQLDRQWLYRDLVFLVLYVACLALALRAGVPRSWVVAGALVVLLPLETGSVTSVARFGLLVPPVYAGLARLGRRRQLDWGLRATAATLLGLGSATILLHWP